MYISLAATLLAGTAVHAFSDTTPFVIFSTAKLSVPDNAAWIQTNKQALDSARSILDPCPTERYLLVSIPNLHASDIQANGKCVMPQLCEAVSSKKTASVFEVQEVWGQMSAKALEEIVTEACSARGKQIVIDSYEMQHLPLKKNLETRADVLSDNDHDLGQLIHGLEEYTILLFSDPNEFKAYEAEFVEPVHMDLKRQAGSLFVGRTQDSHNRTTVPLFEKYQFFTPAIFTSLIVVFLLLSVLYVGLSALSSLEISHGAFEKEMGPAAHKKQS